MKLGQLRGSDVHALLCRNNARVLPFRELTPAYQMSVAQYLSLNENDAWEIPPDLDLWLREHRPGLRNGRTMEQYQGTICEYNRRFAAEFERHMPWYAREYGILPVGVVSIPADELIPLIMMGGDICQDYAGRTFDDYHAWYVGEGYMPDHDVTKPLWPVQVCLDGRDEVLEDGWHRFHDYYRKGVRAIPAYYLP